MYVTPAKKNVNPVFGIVLITVALIYLIVLSIQVYKARNRTQFLDYSESSEYTDLSGSESYLHENQSVGHTCSYQES